MADKLKNIPNYDTQNYPICRLKFLVVKICILNEMNQLGKKMNQLIKKVPKIVEPTNKKTLHEKCKLYKSFAILHVY